MARMKVHEVLAALREQAANAAGTLNGEFKGFCKVFGVEYPDATVEMEAQMSSAQVADQLTLLCQEKPGRQTVYFRGQIEALRRANIEKLHFNVSPAGM